MIGQPLASLDTPQAILDLDVIDANLKAMLAAAKERETALRVHFKSLKCGGLAKYLMERGATSFLCAKVNEAETLADAGVWDILIANQIVGPRKIARVIELARRASVRILVDDPVQVKALSEAASAGNLTLGVLVEVDIGMARCGVEPGEPAVELARLIRQSPGLRFDGLQGYDGHLQLSDDHKQKRLLCHQGLRHLTQTRELLEREGIAVGLVTGGGTGTWEFVAGYPGVTEIQPGSFILMDCIYHNVRSEFACALSVLTTVISRRPKWYVVDAGSKAISKDFGMPVVKGHAGETVVKLSEEHARVDTEKDGIAIGDRREIIPAHCCATMNLHRQCLGVRRGVVETVWPIEASGRYD
jgi:D-serine deaminase-like pyridoxal phosphate-dependent protein